jgi:hypothetical protein
MNRNFFLVSVVQTDNTSPCARNTSKIVALSLLISNRVSYVDCTGKFGVKT